MFSERRLLRKKQDKHEPLQEPHKAPEQYLFAVPQDLASFIGSLEKKYERLMEKRLVQERGGNKSMETLDLEMNRLRQEIESYHIQLQIMITRKSKDSVN